MVGSSEGIEHQYTIPKTPEQNGVFERINRILVEAVRSILVDSRLPHRFWTKALSTAAYLINRNPTKTLSNSTPFKARYRKKPNVNHLQVFGCLAYLHIQKMKKRNWIPRQRSVSSWDMAPQGRAFVFMTRRHRVLFIVMLFSMSLQGGMSLKKEGDSFKWDRRETGSNRTRMCLWWRAWSWIQNGRSKNGRFRWWFNLLKDIL